MGSSAKILVILCALLQSGILTSQTFNGQGGLPVPPGAPTQTVGITTSEALVSGIGIIGNGCTQIDNVRISFQHTWVGDTALFLIAPSGEVLELSSSNGGSGDNYMITEFTDMTALFITQGAPPYDGQFRPEGRQQSTTPPFPNTNPLGTFTFANTFDGVNADGAWTLFINDYVALDVGELISWSITFSSGGGPAPEVDLGPDITICPGESVTLTPAVNPGADSYAWNTGATTPSITVTPTSNMTYMVTATNNGCIGADTIEVIIDPNAVSANAGPDITICAGTSADLNASGGGPGATYTWSNGQTGANIMVAPGTTTTYTVTVTDGNCSGSDEVTVTVTPAPEANAGEDLDICAGDLVTLTGSGGTNNNEYTWSTGQTGQTINVNPLVTTTYLLTVNINGCIDQDEVTVNVTPAPAVFAGPDQVICLGESTDLSASGSPGSYVWSTGQTGTDIIVSPVTTTTYVVTVTDNGCQATDDVEVEVIEVFADIGPDQEICAGETIDLTATGGTVFQWSTGETTQTISVTPFVTTTYSVTVVQGTCSDFADVQITVIEPPVAVVSPDVTICAGEVTSLVASGGTSYAWSNGQNGDQINVSPASTTTYAVTVSDSGCTDTAAVTVEVEATPSISITGDLDICEGESTLLIAEIVGGSAEYLWSTGEVTDEILVSPTQTTEYLLTVTNAAGCSATASAIVVVSPFPSADAGPDQQICAGDIATLTASGGTGPASYLWSTGESGATILVSPMEDEVYQVTITVAGCSATDEVLISVFPVPVADAGPDILICAGDAVELNVTGGETYLWSTGEMTASITVSPLTPTTYSVTVTNTFGCIDFDEITVDVDPGPVADAGPDETICAGDAVILSANGGGTYTWSTGETGPVITVSPITTTVFQVTVTSAAGCTDDDAVTVSVNSLPVANAGSNVFIIPGETATLTATGGGTYLWSTGETTQSIMVSPGVTTTYSVTVTLNGCQDIDEVTVFVNEVPAVSLGPDLTICAGETATLDATIAGPFALAYLWSTGATSQSIDVMPGADSAFSVTVTDPATGFNTADTIFVSVIQIPIGQVTITGESVFCVGSVINYASNSVLFAETYTWSVPAGAIILSGQGTPSIEVDWGTANSGAISLVVSNACGAQPAILFDVLIGTEPVLAGPVTGPDMPCNQAMTGYQIDLAPDADSYQWTLPPGALLVSGQGTPSVVVDWNQSMGGELCVVASNTCGTSAPVCTTILPTAIPQANAGNDTTTCGLMLTLQADAAGIWNVVNGSSTGIFSDPADPNATFSGTTPGVFALEWQVLQSGCEASDTVVVTLLGGPTVSSATTNCNSINTAYTVSFQITDGTSPFTVDGIQIPGNQFTSQELPAGSAFVFEVFDANGCNTFVQGIADCNCTSSAGTMSQEQQSACIGESIAITPPSAVILDGNDILSYVLHDGNFPQGIIQWNASPQFSFIPVMQPGQIYFISAVVADSTIQGLPDLNDPCLAVAAGTPVIFNPVPLANAGADTSIGCDPALVLLDGGQSSPGVAFMWQAINGGMIDGSSDLQKISAVAPGQYLLTVKDPASGCMNTDTVLVTGYIPDLDGFEIELTDPLCFDACTGIIRASGDPGWLYALDFGAYQADAFTDVCGGTHVLRIRDTFGCVTDTMLMLNIPDTLQVDLGPDRTLKAGQTIALMADITGFFSGISWSPEDCSNCITFPVSPLTTTTFQVSVVDDNGCIATDEILLTVIPSADIFVPNIFSPNGDQINDLLEVYANPDLLKIESFEIFDRWGALVYEKPTGSSNVEWDGQSRGKLLDPGVFVYAMKLRLSDDRIVVKRGDITLVR